jgi:hypothetical protein
MHQLLPLIVVAGVLTLSWAGLRLNRAAQPLRLELAEKSETLLASPGLPIHLHDFVRYLQDTAFGNRGTLLFGFVFVPVVAVAMLVRPELLDSAGKRFWIDCPATRAQFDEVTRLHDRITFLNSPILLFMLEVEIVLLVAPAIVFTAIFRGIVNVRIGREIAMDLIDEKSLKIREMVPKLNFAH